MFQQWRPCGGLFAVTPTIPVPCYYKRSLLHPKSPQPDRSLRLSSLQLTSEMLSQTFLLGLLFLLLFCFALLRVFHKLWLGPIRVQKMMAAQGIKGPPYRFLPGTTEEILRMRKEDMETPMDSLSHDISLRIQPHVHTWVNTYATVFPLANDPDAAPRCGRWEDAIDNLFGFGEEVFGLVVLKFTGNGSGEAEAMVVKLGFHVLSDLSTS
ncbi:hypothetical protein SAY86_002713 [Trapa natans]|uniref:Uncharacterized protein n=1 Tax=Trapa natans TaxID=22666 RepID=A0AAN7LJN5_TRANT|nr:hypothetical protein SAY86_002713 [Trapa natans]